ncbi:putative peptidase S10, serine carboxypeptidase, alpha/Beta hydrolase [Helianthus annuus]|nr:putative peptidase S10, serine carboxypeptidase, alpha/Beta hydrolase [Helianthus annuus]
MVFPYMGTKLWIDSLRLRVQSPWKPWFIRTQVAGYEKTYAEANFTLKHATIKVRCKNHMIITHILIFSSSYQLFMHIFVYMEL